MDDSYTLPGPLALSRSTVDRAARLRTDDGWLAKIWADPATKVLPVADGKVQVVDGHLAFASPDTAPEGERYLLGVEGDVVYTAVRVAELAAEAPGASLRDVGTLLGDRDAGLAVHAVALANWHATHTHCPRCGAPTEVSEAGHSRRCVADGTEHYPRTDPAVIMLVTDENDRCLLGRQRLWPPRRHSTLAGFVEPGETPEHAVAREVAEEVGITVDTCRYAGAQPWPFPSSLMLAYYATAAGDVPRPDGEEIVTAAWFTRAELAEALAEGEILLPPPVSVAHRLIRGWYGAGLDELTG